MRIELGDYILEVNVEATREYYKNERYISEGCQCDGCKNYEIAAGRVASEIKDFFSELGIDIKKPAEVYVNYLESDIAYYGGFYHICGIIIKGESPWGSVSKTEKSIVNQLDENNMFCIRDDFRVGFQNECILLSEDFPNPSIQMEISAYLPWLLEAECDYS